MEEQLTSCETAKLAKEKGFDTIKDHPTYFINHEGVILNSKLEIMVTHLSNKGYKRIMLSDTRKNYSIHRLVAIQYIENPNNLPQVNHKDGNKLNNNKSNLEWVSKSENESHAHRTGLKQGYWKNKTGFNHALSKTVIQIETGRLFGSTTEVERELGISASTVNQVCLGNRKTASGFTWKYYEVNELVELARSKKYYKYPSDFSNEGWFIYLSLLQKWLREVHKSHIVIDPFDPCNSKYHVTIYYLVDGIYNDGTYKDYKTYEEALEIGLQELLKQIK